MSNSFSALEFLAQHASPEAALNALNRQLEEAGDGRDREGRAAQAARRERDAARTELDTARESLTQAQARALPEGGLNLTPEQAQQWQQFTERGGLQTWDADRAQAQQGTQFRQEALTTRLAAANGWSPERVTRLLAGRTLDEREITPEGGAPVQTIGLVSGETFTPAVQEFADFAPSLTATPTAPQPSWPRQDAPRPSTPATSDQLDAERAGSGMYQL